MFIIGLQTGNVPISNIGYSQDSRDKEGISRNTIVGDVEIGTSTGATINTDLSKVNEVTKDVSKTTNINVESQTIKYAVNPDKLKEDIGKAKQEISDVTRAFKESVVEKFYVNPLQKSLDKQVKLEIVAGFHSHGASYDLYFDEKIPGYKVTTGDGEIVPSSRKKSANYFSLIPFPHISSETNEYLLKNNITSDTLYTYYNNKELSVVTPRKIGEDDKDIIKPSIWIFTPVDVINHKGRLKYLGISDDYRNPLNKDRFSTEGGTETVPNIIFNNQFHDLDIIKNWNEELEKRIRGD